MRGVSGRGRNALKPLFSPTAKAVISGLALIIALRMSGQVPFSQHSSSVSPSIKKAVERHYVAPSASSETTSFSRQFGLEGKYGGHFSRFGRMFGLSNEQLRAGEKFFNELGIPTYRGFYTLQLEPTSAQESARRILAKAQKELAQGKAGNATIAPEVRRAFVIWKMRQHPDAARLVSVHKGIRRVVLRDKISANAGPMAELQVLLGNEKTPAGERQDHEAHIADWDKKLRRDLRELKL